MIQIDNQWLMYDAVTLFGFDDLFPNAVCGEIIIRYGGWSFQELCDSDIGKKLINHPHSYEKYAWSKEKFPVGFYRLCIPVPKSNCKNATEQRKLFKRGERFAPTVLVATALLVHQVQKGEYLLGDYSVRCKERMSAPHDRVELGWFNGLLCASGGWSGHSSHHIWAASIRTSSIHELFSS